MQHDSAALRVLYIGGTGTISSSCVRLSLESRKSVKVLNRGIPVHGDGTSLWTLTHSVDFASFVPQPVGAGS